MKRAYIVLARLIAALVVVQVAAIAWGTFAMLHDIDNGAVITSDTRNFAQSLHANVGYIVIPAVALIFFVVSFFLKIPGAVKWASIVFGLVALQGILAGLSFAAPVVGALHGLNALAIAGMSAAAAQRLRTTAPHDASSAETPAEYAETKARTRRFGRGRASV
ncbi:hypothetical protein [Pengzhenrongella sp.]|jgi:hypothetical protein|uniref:hypothetical protein n=1 Tax=Pengzhenrongella sp. TaxID=2888820 RepID=UPI002F95216B